MNGKLEWKRTYVPVVRRNSTTLPGEETICRLNLGNFSGGSWVALASQMDRKLKRKQTSFRALVDGAHHGDAGRAHLPQYQELPEKRARLPYQKKTLPAHQVELTPVEEGPHDR